MGFRVQRKSLTLNDLECQLCILMFDDEINRNHSEFQAFRINLTSSLGYMSQSLSFVTQMCGNKAVKILSTAQMCV